MVFASTGGFLDDLPPMVRDLVRLGEERNIHFPDGSIIEVRADGSFVVNDKDAKITYKANRIREFNRFLNVSDRLEEFIKFCDSAGVKSDEMLNLPISLFVAWVCLEAAKADNEPPPEDVKLLPNLRKYIAPKCPSCGRFISRALKLEMIDFCRPECFTVFFNQKAERRLIPCS
jgi:hypothetical protein